MEGEAVEVFVILSMCKFASELNEDEYIQHIDALLTKLNVFATGASGWVVEILEQLEKNCCLWQCHWGFPYRNTAISQTIELFQFECGQ